MRVLIGFAGGYGHFAPLIPVARALAESGHTVVVAGRPAQVANIRDAGFEAIAAGDPSLDPAPERRPLRPIHSDAEDRVLRDGFAGVVARDRAAALLAIIGDWRPDLMLCDEADFGAMVAAERRDLPHASVVSMVAGTFQRPALLADPLARLRAEHGLPDDPGLEMLSRELVLVPAPPAFRSPAAPLPATARSIRPTSPDPAEIGDDRASAEPPPGTATAASVSGASAAGTGPTAARTAGSGWFERRAGAAAGRSERPLVYVSLGTAFNVESGDLFGRVIAGLRDLPVDALVTVGNEIDPAEFGTLPSSIRVERFVPQWSVLPGCDLVVSHGGSGGVVGALTHGLPLVVLPLGADQPHNAARVEALGVGRVLDAAAATPAELAAAVEAVLVDRSARAAAEALRAECEALPPPEAAVSWLEALTSP